MIRVAVFSPFFPFPVTEGAYRVILEQVSCLQKSGAAVNLVVWKNQVEGVSRLLKLSDEIDLAPDTPIVFLTARGSETWQMDQLRNLDKASATLAETRWERGFRVFSSLFRQESSSELFYYPPDLPYEAALKNCDLALFHYTFGARVLERLAANHPKLSLGIYAHNIESDLYSDRVSGQKLGFVRLLDFITYRKLLKLESSIGKQRIFLLVLNDMDREGFLKLGLPEDQVQILPPAYNSQLQERRKLRFAKTPRPERATWGFLGGLHFGPNRDSAIWILERLLPELRKRNFRGRIVIAGGGGEDLRRAHPNSEMLEWAGFVGQADSFFCSLTGFLAPHIRGSGVRIKILDSLSFGLPTATTTLGAQRLSTRAQTHDALFVSDDPGLWADHICRGEGPSPSQSHLDDEFVYKEWLTSRSTR